MTSPCWMFNLYYIILEGINIPLYINIVVFTSLPVWGLASSLKMCLWQILCYFSIATNLQRPWITINLVTYFFCFIKSPFCTQCYSVPLPYPVLFSPSILPHVNQSHYHGSYHLVPLLCPVSSRPLSRPPVPPVILPHLISAPVFRVISPLCPLFSRPYTLCYLAPLVTCYLAPCFPCYLCPCALHARQVCYSGYQRLYHGRSLVISTSIV